MKHAIFLHVVGTSHYQAIHHYETLAKAFAGLKKIQGKRTSPRSVIQDGHAVEWFLPPVVKCGNRLSFQEASALADATEDRFYQLTEKRA